MQLGMLFESVEACPLGGKVIEPSSTKDACGDADKDVDAVKADDDTDALRSTAGDEIGESLMSDRTWSMLGDWR
jgi:hypothetical protein